MFPGVLFLRQEKSEEGFAYGSGYSGSAAEPDDSPELGIQLGRLAIDDVALKRGRCVRRKGVEAGQSPFDGFGAEVGLVGARELDDLADGARCQLARFRHGSPDPDRDACGRPDPAHRCDEDKLRPQRVVDVGWDVRLHAGARVALLRQTPEFAAGQARIFDEDKQNAKLISYKEWKGRGLCTKLLEKILSPFRSQL